MKRRLTGERQWITWRILSALKRRVFGAPEANARKLEDVLEEAEGGRDDFSDEERHMLKNLLGFRDVTLDDVMVPRAEIDGLEIDIDRRSAAALRRMRPFAHAGLSRDIGPAFGFPACQGFAVHIGAPRRARQA